MIGSLRGVVLDRLARPGQAGEVLLEVGGVGYRVLVPAGSLGQIGTPGSPAFLHIHTHVREDALLLYGFPSREERVCFEALIGAHGVGPAVALGLLSVHSPIALQRAVLADELAQPAGPQGDLFRRFDGIGGWSEGSIRAFLAHAVLGPRQDHRAPASSCRASRI